MDNFINLPDSREILWPSYGCAHDRPLLAIPVSTGTFKINFDDYKVGMPVLCKYITKKTKKKPKFFMGIISAIKASGLKWRIIPNGRPISGKKLTNQKLAEALRTKTNFTETEWETFGVKFLHMDHFIQSSTCYYEPEIRDKKVDIEYDDGGFQRNVSIHFLKCIHTKETRTFQKYAYITPQAIVLTPSNARLAVDYALSLVKQVNALMHKTYDNDTESDDTSSDTCITSDDDMCTILQERFNTARGTLDDPIVLL